MSPTSKIIKNFTYLLNEELTSTNSLQLIKIRSTSCKEMAPECFIGSMNAYTNEREKKIVYKIEKDL